MWKTLRRLDFAILRSISTNVVLKDGRLWNKKFSPKKERNMKITKQRFKREAINVTCTLVAALFSAFGMHYFVSSAEFAPAGLDGVATMIAHVLKVSPAYFILALNLPLLIVAWFILKKDM